MAGSEQESCARTTRIRELNDELRRHGQGGLIGITRGVSMLGNKAVVELLAAVRRFDEFTPGNDPYGEHDFGSIKLAGGPFFWKIDYYDADRLAGSPDPTDPAVTCRVLTIMLAEEY